MQPRALDLIKEAQKAITNHQYDIAEQCANEALRQQPQSADAYACLGWALSGQVRLVLQEEREGKMAASLQALNNAIALEPRHLMARFMLAKHYLEQKNSVAFKENIQVVTADALYANQYEWGRQLGEVAFLWLGNEALEQREFLKAYHDYAMAQTINSNNKHALQGMGVALTNNHENPVSTVKWFYLITELFPDLNLEHAYAGALWKEGFINESVRRLKQLRSLSTADQVLLAVGMVHQGKADEAWQSVQRFLCDSALSATDLYFLAVTALAAKKPHQALALLANAQDASLLIFKACIYESLGDLVAFNKEMEMLNNRSLMFLEKAHVLILRGRLAKTQEDRAALNEELKLLIKDRADDKDNPKLVSIALAAFACGDEETAKKYLMPFLTQYYPQAALWVFQKELIKLLSTLSKLTPEEIAKLKHFDRREVKNQLLVMIRSAVKGDEQLIICLRALCRESLLGSIFHIKRDKLGKKPSIIHGALQAIAKALNEMVRGRDNQGIDGQTINLLKNEIRISSSFAENLEKKYPDLYQWMKTLTPDMFPPKGQRLRLMDAKVPQKKEKEREEDLYRL